MLVFICPRSNSILIFGFQTETATLEFRNPRLERLMGLTAADRKWMDEIVRDVNDAWDDADPMKPAMQCVTLWNCLVPVLIYLTASKAVMITCEPRLR
jgi:hypothetical protein